MKKIAILSATAICSAVISYASTNTISEISPYVFPNNRAASPASMVFMPDGETYLLPNEAHTQILSYETKTGKEIGVVFDVATARESKISSFTDFSINDKGNYLLIYTDKEMIYRRSFRAAYYTYEIQHNILRPLSDKFNRQQSPIFSPDGRTVAFVAENNIYMRKLDYNSEVQVTNDGSLNKIINGVPDWTYEEEFTTTCSMAFTADSEMFCYLKYNETEVPVYTFPLYEGACDPDKKYALYPGHFDYKYPVAGEKNSKVSLHAYNVANRDTKEIKFEDSRIEYIPSIKTTSDRTAILAVTLDRDQNRMDIYRVNPKSTLVSSLYQEKHTAWISPSCYEQLTVTPASFIVTSTRSGYAHLYEYNFEGAPLRQITSGDYDVTACYGTDKVGNVYFQTTKSGPLNRVITKIDAKGKVTDLTPDDKFSSATFSPLCNYFVLNTSDCLTPPVYTLKSGDGKVTRIVEDNAKYKASLPVMPTKEFFTVTSDGYELNAYMIKPAGFDSSRKYPVIMWQYSGPGSQEVNNSWRLDWDYYAATQGFIVVCVDGRGTGFRGRKFMDVVYRDLGHYETIDQINAAKQIQQLPYVDKKLIGISGWSYGGYEALMCATDTQSPFAACVAIAPVTDWRYYDTVYAERYMLTPKQNEDGYRSSAPLNRTANLKCPLLIMHGTADDNVHLANTMEFAARLINQGKYCDMLMFPNMNHSIFGCGARAVVYGRMIDYFKEKLNQH